MGGATYEEESLELVRRPDVHHAVADPQLLHHRPHRPRQVDAGRPHAAAHRRRRRAHDAGPVPRPHGHRARARHHDQGAERAAAVEGRRHRARAAPDRHPRPRRLHLRGVAGRWRPARARSCWSTRRRASRRRRWPTSTWRWRRTSRSSRCSTRSTCLPPTRTGTPPRSRTSSAATPAEVLRVSAKTGQGVGEAARRGGAPGARARRRRRRPGPRDDLRLGLRHLPRRHHLHPGGRRRDHPARADQDDVHRRHPRAARGRHRLAGAQAVDRAWVSARSAT